MKSIVLGLMIVLVFPLYAGQTARIDLDDGSSLYGEFLAFDGDSYSIKTPTLGTVRIPAGKVTAFEVGSDAPKTARKTVDSAVEKQRKYVEKQVASNGQLLEDILSLQNNSAMQAILADQELMRAISSGDLARLKNDPRIERLMQDEQLQSLRRLLAP